MAEKENDLGAMGVCDQCAGENRRTGRRRNKIVNGFGGTVHDIVCEELQCQKCGRRVLNELGTDGGTKTITP